MSPSERENPKVGRLQRKVERVVLNAQPFRLSNRRDLFFKGGEKKEGRFFERNPQLSTKERGVIGVSHMVRRKKKSTQRKGKTPFVH